MLDRPIKMLGMHAVRVALHPEVIVDVEANVARTAEEAEAQTEAAARGEVLPILAEAATAAAAEESEASVDAPADADRAEPVDAADSVAADAEVEAAGDSCADSSGDSADQGDAEDDPKD